MDGSKILTAGLSYLLPTTNSGSPIFCFWVGRQMQNKSSEKIIVDKVKLQTLQRLGCPEKAIADKILYNKFTPQNDSLLDLFLESLTDEKSFSNWGGSRKNAGRKASKISGLNQDENQVENQDEKIKLNKSRFNQVVDKDNNIYNNIYLNNNTKTRKENIIKEKNKRYGECQNVILTEDQFNKLSAEHNNLNEAIEKLDTWLGTSGGKNKNKNHYPYFKSNSWVWEGINKPVAEKKETSLVDYMETIKIDENLRFDETMPEFSDMTFEECTRAYEWMQQNMYGKELPRVKFIKIVHKFKNC